MTEKSQNEKVLAALMSGRSITAVDALREFGCFRLAARIAVLREMGHQIDTEYITRDGKRFALYTLARAA